MRKVYEALTTAFRRNDGYLSPDAYERIVRKNSSFCEDAETLLLLLQASGYPISQEDGKYRLETYFTPYTQQKFCVIDIETNGSKPDNSQVIEIGAVMIQNGDVLNRFESFVECAFLPEYISKITGISPEDLKDAPSQVEVLSALREFMEDAIFVAHNVNFDYEFLNHSFDRFGLGNIGNPKLCSIELAKRTIESERYGLAYLSDTLELGNHIKHRAYSDALVTSRLLQLTFGNLPTSVNVTDELLRFSVSSRKERKMIKEDKTNKN
jgi:DNA polymerase-3 subunit epsilon